MDELDPELRARVEHMLELAAPDKWTLYLLMKELILEMHRHAREVNPARDPAELDAEMTAILAELRAYIGLLTDRE